MVISNSLAYKMKDIAFNTFMKNTGYSTGCCNTVNMMLEIKK